MKINPYFTPILRMHRSARELARITREFEENREAERWIGRFALAMVLLIGFGAVAFAYPAGECKSSDLYFKEVTFKAEEFLDVQGAIEFQKKNKGQLIKEHDKDQWFVIYSPHVAAPESQYQCVKVGS